MDNHEIALAEFKKMQEKSLNRKDFLSAGVSPINLSLTGDPNKGFCKGHIYRFMGRPSSGKTFIAHTILACAASNPEYSKHQLIYDDVELGALMNVRKFFGEQLAKRLVAPAYDANKRPIYSRYLSDFYRRLLLRLNANKPVVWVEDSMDSLQPPVISTDKSGKVKTAATKMGDGKAKYNSQFLPKVLDKTESTQSIIILLHQVRSGMGQSWGDDEVVSGGIAPEHYSTVDIHLKRLSKITKTVKGKPYTVGSRVQATIRKNRVSGVDRSCEYIFLYDYGIDDISTCIYYLLSTKHWKEHEKKSDAVVEDEEYTFEGSRRLPKNVIAPEFDYRGTVEGLIAKVEEEGLYHKLQSLMAKVWKEIEDSLKTKREPRFF